MICYISILQSTKKKKHIIFSNWFNVNVWVIGNYKCQPILLKTLCTYARTYETTELTNIGDNKFVPFWYKFKLFAKLFFPNQRTIMTFWENFLLFTAALTVYIPTYSATNMLL